MAKWALITEDHNIVTKRAKNGTPRAMIQYVAGAEPQPTTTDHLAEMVAAGKATEVDAPEDKGVKAGKAVAKPGAGVGGVSTGAAAGAGPAGTTSA